MAQSKLGFYHLRNKSLTRLWRPVTGPPNDLPTVPLPVTRWLERTVKGENRSQFSENLEIWESLVSICVKGEIRSLSMSAHETLRSSGGMHTLGAATQ